MNYEHHKLNNERQYDTLERLMTTRPVVRAPHNTAARVLARIATLPQEVPTANFAPPKLNPVRYNPPAALPLPEIQDRATPSRRVTGLMFTSAWLGLVALLVYVLIWPLINNLFLGGQEDMSIGLRLVQLGNGLLRTVTSLIELIAPVLPSLLSGIVGLAIMLMIFGTQRQRLRMR